MKVPGLSPKASTAVIAGLLFFVVSSPIVYKLVDKILGRLVGPIASSSGCPTTLGLLVHSAVFAAVVYSGVAL
jgi:uncharacterized membrane protein (DUF106 family)